MGVLVNRSVCSLDRGALHEWVRLDIVTMTRMPMAIIVMTMATTMIPPG